MSLGCGGEIKKMIPIKCSNPSCQATFELNEKTADIKHKTMQCPVCGNQNQLNPLYKGG